MVYFVAVRLFQSYLLCHLSMCVCVCVRAQLTHTAFDLWLLSGILVPVSYAPGGLAPFGA